MLSQTSELSLGGQVLDSENQPIEGIPWERVEPGPAPLMGNSRWAPGIAMFSASPQFAETLWDWLARFLTSAE